MGEDLRWNEMFFVSSIYIEESRLFEREVLFCLWGFEYND
jgi:hypothetical protein